MTTKLQQMCANEQCDKLVPAQVGPKLCPDCEKRERKAAHDSGVIIAREHMAKRAY